jgi:hypothetical protein
MSTSTPSPPTQGIGGFDGDSKSDILWRYNGGTTVLWLINGSTKLSDVSLNNISTDWAIPQANYDIV